VSRDRFEVHAQAWLEPKRPRLEDSTYRNYERDLRLRLIPEFGSLRLRDLTRERVEAYLARLDAEGKLSRTSINDSLIPLKGILQRAVTDGHIPNNPALDLDRDEPLKLPEDRAGDALSQPRRRPAVSAGLPRLVSPSRRTLDGQRRLPRRGGRARVARRLGRAGDPRRARGEGPYARDRLHKTDAGRAALIDPFLVGVLQEQRERQKGDSWLGRLIFPSRAGATSRTDRCGSMVTPSPSSGRAWPGLRIHDLRHTAATLWLAAGESIYFVQQQLWHTNVQTTIGLYGHPDQKAHAAAAARAAVWWREGTGTTAGTTTPISALNRR
jgi:integrase